MEEAQSPLLTQLYELAAECRASTACSAATVSA